MNSDGPANHPAELNGVIEQSRRKIIDTERSLRPWISSSTCRKVFLNEAECFAYRCKCSFQLIVIQENESPKATLGYAIRKDGSPCLITSFPLANRRIQQGMVDVLEALNDEDTLVDANHYLAHQVTSVSFSSSWRDDPSSTCLVTLHYDTPIADEMAWQLQASALCQKAGLAQITGRSKGRFVCTTATKVDTAAGDNDGSVVIHDTVYIIQRAQDGKPPPIYIVSLDTPKEGQGDLVVSVEYRKPEGAFFHPNAGIMCRALEWILSRLQAIQGGVGDEAKSPRPMRLLELYSGCGAHTVPIAKTASCSRGLHLSHITTVEYDERLVEACRDNCRRNGLELVHGVSGSTGCQDKATNEDNHDDLATKTGCSVACISADAGPWMASQHQQDSDYDVLLVDPPRQGLDPRVVQAILKSRAGVDSILYISCGKEALLRDLQALSGNYQVVDCTLLDLFPQTYAVESLVHLQKTPNPSTVS